MNSSEQTTVATLAVFFALIFLLIMITMCCILRRGCRKETTREGHKRYRFRSDWDKSGTLTSSETRITEAIPANDNASASLATSTSDKTNQGTTGVLVRIEEETTADSSGRTDSVLSRTDSVDKRVENENVQPDENSCQGENCEANCEMDEGVKLIDGHKHGVNHTEKLNTTCSCISTHLNSKKKRENRKDKQLTKFEEPESSNCSTGESLKELINDSDTAGLSTEE